jgi:O-methyltransferase involved in polyketide biosynthesis
VEADRAGPLGIDPSKMNVARLYDYWLGGTHNFEADRAAAAQILAAVPEAPFAAQANRGFVRRATRYAAGQGIRQFVDIGAGLPTQGNVHEIAQAVTPEAHVVYVDHDPIVLAHSRALLHGNPRVRAILADLRDPAAIIADPALRELIDFTLPVAVLLTGVLHFIADDEQAVRVVTTLAAQMAPGSYLILSHGSGEGMDPAALGQGLEVYARASEMIYSRDRAEIRRFFDQFDIVEPGVVFTPQWRPEPDQEVADPAQSRFLCAVGRKRPLNADRTEAPAGERRRP